MKLLLKKIFPRLYSLYQHLCRKKLILKIGKLRKLDISDRKKLLEEVYYKKIGAILDWDNMKRYTAKMQWDKLFNYNPMKSRLADKYLVREWVKERIGQEYLVPLLGVWDSFDEIDFAGLPEQFVLKTNHGSGQYLIVKKKSKIDVVDAKWKFDDWMQMDYAYVSYFEMHYSDIKRRIIAEEYLEDNNGELLDYKFLCFNGIPKFCWVDIDRFANHTRTFFDMNWVAQSWTEEYCISSRNIEKPRNFEEMKRIATVLSEGFEHVRVDLYDVNGKIYFGEMTFTSESGLGPFFPDEYDYILGEYWNIC